MDTFCNNFTFSGVRKYHNKKRQNMHLRHRLCQTYGLGLPSIRVCTFSILQNWEYLEFNWLNSSLRMFSFFLFFSITLVRILNCYHPQEWRISWVVAIYAQASLDLLVFWMVHHHVPEFQFLPSVKLEVWLCPHQGQTRRHAFLIFSAYGLCCNKNSGSGLCSGTGYWV